MYETKDDPIIKFNSKVHKMIENIMNDVRIIRNTGQTHFYVKIWKSLAKVCLIVFKFYGTKQQKKQQVQQTKLVQQHRKSCTNNTAFST